VNGHVDKDYIFANRAVAFIDVLGFGAKLNEFDEEARNNLIEEDNEIKRYISPSANRFINTFLNAIELLDPNKYRYYLFSDNLCITSIDETSPTDLEDLLFVIANLYYELAKAGYFIRGGIDYGLFVDEGSIAVGMPLAHAYRIESKVAVYPRIVLSKNFVDQLAEKYTDQEGMDEGNYLRLLLSHSCELTYLNVFMHVFQTDFETDKIQFFHDMNFKIIESLDFTKGKETVHHKFKWLAEEFNKFLDSYSDELVYLDENYEPDDNYIDTVKQQRIEYAN